MEIIERKPVPIYELACKIYGMSKNSRVWYIALTSLADGWQTRVFAHWESGEKVERFERRAGAMMYAWSLAPVLFMLHDLLFWTALPEKRPTTLREGRSLFWRALSQGGQHTAKTQGRELL